MKLGIKVIPGARQEGLEWLDDILKVKVAVAPEKGKANKAVEKLLAGHLGIPASRVKIVSGHTRRQKTVEITGMTEDAIRKHLGKTT